MKTSVLVAVILQVSFLTSVAAGQRIGGSVSARDTGQPIASALVQLIAQDSTVLRTVLTDESGRFGFATEGCGPRNGYLYIVRLGYRALRAAILDLPEDCSAWSITLEVDPVRLPEVTVQVSRNRDLERVGFYSRKRIGLGTFIDREALEKRYSTQSQVAEVIQQVPNVFRVDQAQNSAVIYLRMVASFSGPCAAAIYVDGLFQRKVLPRMATLDVEALEIYRGPAQVPVQYGGADAACGVVVIWTRTGAGK